MLDQQFTKAFQTGLRRLLDDLDHHAMYDCKKKCVEYTCQSMVAAELLRHTSVSHSLLVSLSRRWLQFLVKGMQGFQKTCCGQILSG